MDNINGVNGIKKIMEDKRPPVGINCILFNSSGEILLGLRAQGFFGGGLWNIPGGKINPGETLEEGAKRKLFEETNFVANIEDIEVINVTNMVMPDNNYLQFAAIIKKYSGELKNNDPQKHEKFEYYRLSNLPQDLTPLTRGGINLYLKNKFYDPEENKRF